jgi:hypothetical protein
MKDADAAPVPAVIPAEALPMAYQTQEAQGAE